MSHSNSTLRHESEGEKSRKIANRQKRKKTKNICAESPVVKSGGRFLSRERLPLIGFTRSKPCERYGHSTLQHTIQAGKRKHAQQPVSVALHDTMAPWEGSSNSESSFTSIPPPLPLPHPPPQPPAPITSPKVAPPPRPITDTPPGSGTSVCVKRHLLPMRAPSRPTRLPPLHQVTNLSFSRSFTFSFFELPFHQSAQSRADRLKDLIVLLRQIHY